MAAISPPVESLNRDLFFMVIRYLGRADSARVASVCSLWHSQIQPAANVLKGMFLLNRKQQSQAWKSMAAVGPTPERCNEIALLIDARKERVINRFFEEIVAPQSRAAARFLNTILNALTPAKKAPAIRTWMRHNQQELESVTQTFSQTVPMPPEIALLSQLDPWDLGRAFWNAALLDDVETLSAFLRPKIMERLPMTCVTTAFGMAARAGNVECMELLLRRREMIAKISDMNEVLRVAVNKGHRQFVENQLSRPEIAERISRLTIVQALTRVDNEDLRYAAFLLSRPEIVEKLSTEAADTALLRAEWGNKVIYVRWLLDRPEIIDKLSEEAIELFLHRARPTCHNKCSRLLRHHPELVARLRQHLSSSHV